MWASTLMLNMLYRAAGSSSGSSPIELAINFIREFVGHVHDSDDEKLLSYVRVTTPIDYLKILLRRHHQVVDEYKEDKPESSFVETDQSTSTPMASSSSLSSPPPIKRRKTLQSQSFQFDGNKVEITRFPPLYGHVTTLNFDMTQKYDYEQLLAPGDDGTEVPYLRFEWLATPIPEHVRTEISEHTKEMLSKKSQATRTAFEDDSKRLSVTATVGQVLMTKEQRERMSVKRRTADEDTANTSWVDTHIYWYYKPNSVVVLVYDEGSETEYSFNDFPQMEYSLNESSNVVMFTDIPIWDENNINTFMYILLEEEGHYTLNIAKYFESINWWSKHGVLTGSNSKLLVCSGIFARLTNSLIYIDNLSGTFSPSDKQLQLCKECLEKGTNHTVLTYTEEELIRDTTFIFKTHPDYS